MSDWKFSEGYKDKKLQIVEFNNVNHSQLPFIIIPQYGFKLLIDSGSSTSFLRPSLADKYFSKEIKHDPIVVTVINQNNIINKSIEIPAFEIFDTPHYLPFKFHLLEFHNYFDGIIGLDILLKLNAKLN